MSNRSNFGPFSTAPRLPSRPPLRRARFSDDDASHHRVQAPVSSSRTPSPSQASPSSYRPVVPRAELRPSCDGDVDAEQRFSLHGLDHSLLRAAVESVREHPAHTKTDPAQSSSTRPQQDFLDLTTRNQEEEQPPSTPRTGGKSSTDDGSPFKANYSLAVPGSPTAPVSSTVARDISPLDDDGGPRPSISNTFAAAAAAATTGRGAASPFAPFMPPAPHMSETLVQQQQQYLQQLHELHAAQQNRQQPATYGEAITPASFFATNTLPTNVEPLAAALPADARIQKAEIPYSGVDEDNAPGECSSAPSRWKSVAGRRPTSHLVLINDDEEESIDTSARHGPTNSTGNSHKVDQWLNGSDLPRSTPEERGYTQPSLLMSKRRSISLGRLSSASCQFHPTPPTPARLASHHLNGVATSQDMPENATGTPRLSPTRAASSSLQPSQADLDDSCEKGVVSEPIAAVAPAEDGQSYFATAQQLLAGLYRSQNSASSVQSAKESLPQAQRPRTPRQYPSQSSFGDASTLADTPVKEGFEVTDKAEDKIATPVSDPLAKEKLSRRTLANQRRRASMAFTLGMDDEPMEDDDPRVTGKVRKSVQVKREQEEMRSLNRRCSWSSEHGDPTVPMRPRRRLSLASVAGRIMRRMSVTPDDQEQDEDGRYTKANRDPAKKIQYHVAHVLQRQRFILKLARALMLFGAPSHRIESQLNATATVLEVDAQFIHFPGIVIASFGDFDSHTSETHFVKSKTDLALGSLHRVHNVYKKVVHDEMGVEEGAEELTAILHAKPVWSVSSRVLFSFIKCFIMAPLSFGGSIVDACIAGIFGGFLTFLQLHVAGKNQMYSNVFEISMAIIISFVSRGLSSTGVFCYQAIASSGVILVLPGYVVCEFDSSSEFTSPYH
ncbi:hypothetical protein L7F22_031489 [Adiantum nelumboides]|nr:hypothetical protein [Adiantum nelumboides]